MRKLIFLLILATILLVACSGDNVGTEITNEDGLTYTIVTIEGMTCIYYERYGYEAGYGGLTCNWNEWRQ